MANRLSARKQSHPEKSRGARQPLHLSAFFPQTSVPMPYLSPAAPYGGGGRGTMGTRNTKEQPGTPSGTAGNSQAGVRGTLPSGTARGNRAQPSAQQCGATPGRHLVSRQPAQLQKPQLALEQPVDHALRLRPRIAACTTHTLHRQGLLSGNTGLPFSGPSKQVPVR